MAAVRMVERAAPTGRNQGHPYTHGDMATDTGLAEPLEDTLDSAIRKVLDAAEASRSE